MRPLDTCVGIDLARRAKHKAVVVRNNGGRRATRKRAFAFAQDREGFFAVREFVLEQVDATSLAGIAVVLEPTGASQVRPFASRSTRAACRTDSSDSFRDPQDAPQPAARGDWR